MAGKDTNDSGKSVEVTVPAKGMRAEAASPKAKNAGPLRGNNSFPASNKRRVNDVSRTTRTADPASRAGAGGKYGKGSETAAADEAAAAAKK